MRCLPLVSYAEGLPVANMGEGMRRYGASRSRIHAVI